VLICSTDTDGEFLCVLYCSPSECQLSSSIGSAPHSFPNFQHPSHELLRENGFVWQVYNKYHARCLKGIYVLCFLPHFTFHMQMHVISFSAFVMTIGWNREHPGFITATTVLQRLMFNQTHSNTLIILYCLISNFIFYVHCLCFCFSE